MERISCNAKRLDAGSIVIAGQINALHGKAGWPL